jgi:Tol biopolymer transport system component
MGIVTSAAQGAPVGGPVRSFDLPEGRAVSMSPDGTKLAAVRLPSTSLCVYDVETEAEVSCADLTGLNSGIRTDDIVWSPDSTRLAFGETSFLDLKDGDLWVMDASTGALTDLTDDQYDGDLLFSSDAAGDQALTVDTSPAWTPDGQFITYSSSLFRGKEALGNVIAQIPADGSAAPETLVTVSPTEIGIAYFGAAWSPDGATFYYSVAFPDRENPDNGIWAYDKATGSARLLAAGDDPALGPLALKEVSPAGDRLLAYYPADLTQMGHLAHSSLRFVDPATGALSAVPEPDGGMDGAMYTGTWIAAFSPDGRYLLQLTGADAGSREAWVTELATGASTEVASDLDDAVPIEYALGPVWGSNGLVFIAHNIVGAYFFPIDGAGLGQSSATGSVDGTPVASPEASTPISSPTAPGIPAGGTVQSLDLPAGRAVSMSPDGRLVAAVEPNTTLCIYTAETVEQVRCADLSEIPAGVRTEDIVWSPDSTRLAFSENVFRYFRDGDLWVMDAQTGALTNLTDDHYDGSVMIGADDGVTYYADVAPSWTPDSQFITFSRTTFAGNASHGNTLAQIPASGGEVETLATVSPEEMGVVYYRGGWSPDGATFYYNVSHADVDDPDNGIWVYEAVTGETRKLAQGNDPDLGPLAVREVSPAGDLLLGWYPLAAGQFGMSTAGLLTFVDPVTGALSPVPDPSGNADTSWVATFSPDGRYLLQSAGISFSEIDYWVTELASGQSTEVASDLDAAAPIELGLGPVWASDGTIFVARSLDGFYRFPVTGAGISTISQPDAIASATPEPAAGTLAEGADVVTTGIAPIFAGPDAEAPVVHFLPPNQIVHILGAAVENEEGTWYPIFDPQTQIIGYVQADRLEETA